MLRDEFAGAKINYSKLPARLLPVGLDLLRTYYYCCPPYQSNPPTNEEKERKSKFDRFHAVLENIPRFQVRLGKLAFRGFDATTHQPRFEQKRVDILLGVDLVHLASKGQIAEAILVAGDSDFLPAIEAAKDEGVLFRLYHGKLPHRDILMAADERTQIDQAFIDSVR